MGTEDLQKIEKEMERIVGENLPIVRKEVSRAEARRKYVMEKKSLNIESR